MTSNVTDMCYLCGDEHAGMPSDQSVIQNTTDMARKSRTGKRVKVSSSAPSPVQAEALSRTAEALRAIGLQLEESARVNGVPSVNVDVAQKDASDAMVHLAIELSGDDGGRTHSILSEYGFGDLYDEGKDLVD